MASPTVLDLENLLAPIAADNPCGRDPRADMSPTAPFFLVKDAYDRAKEAERSLERGFDEAAQANDARQRMQRGWLTVCEHGPEIIATIGKDLLVTVWLSEALLRQCGPRGLRDGLRLAAGLVDRYWDGAFPQRDPEADDPDDDPRLLAFGMLAGSDRDCKLATPLRKIALSDGDKGEPVTLWEYQNGGGSGDAADPANSIDERMRQSAPAFKRDLADDAEACAAAADALEVALAARCGSSAPGFAGIRSLTEQIAAAGRRYAESTESDAPEPEAAPASEEAIDLPATAQPAQAVAAAATARQPVGGLDRQSAFRQLEEIAAFFRRTEPHSPIAYALENIVRRGRMNLPELLHELIGDEAARQNYFIAAGMRPPDKSA